MSGIDCSKKKINRTIKKKVPCCIWRVEIPVVDLAGFGFLSVIVFKLLGFVMRTLSLCL
jgi:hypothetical protein